MEMVLFSDDFLQVWLLLRLLNANWVSIVALLPGVQDAPLLQCHPLSKQLPPRHVGSAHEDSPGCQVASYSIRNGWETMMKEV